MSSFAEVMFGIFSGALETVGESKLVEVLQQLHDESDDQYKAAIYGGHALVTALLPVVAGTGTKIDDAIVKALDEAIRLSASLNGVELSVTVVIDVPTAEPVKMVVAK